MRTAKFAQDTNVTIRIRTQLNLQKNSYVTIKLNTNTAKFARDINVTIQIRRHQNLRKTLR